MKNLLPAETISKDGSVQTIPAPDGVMNITMETPDEYVPFANGELCPRVNRKLKPVTVLLAENRTIVRQGICALLAQANGINVVGQALDGKQAMEMAEKLRPDVVIICVALAFLNRMQVTRRILQSVPGSRVIILARHGDDAYVKHAATLGVAGYLTEQVSGQMLARAVRSAHQGSPVFNSALLRCLPETSRPLEETSVSAKMIEQLTSRQRQVLQFIAEGNANKQTASDLAISIKTVEKHRQELMTKLGIHDTAGLTRYAIAAGIVGCDLHQEPQPEEAAVNSHSRQQRWLSRPFKVASWNPAPSVKKQRVQF